MTDDEFVREVAALQRQTIEHERCERLKTMCPDIDAVRWIAIGLALANKKFAKRLFDELDMTRAFGEDGPASDCIALVELIMLGETKTAPFLESIGVLLRDGEKLSGAIIRTLQDGDKEAWESRLNRADYYVRQIREATAKLLTLARRAGKLNANPKPKSG